MSGTLDAVTPVPTAGTDDASSKPGRHTNGHEDSAGDRWRRLLACLPEIEKNVRLAVFFAITVLGVSVVIKGAIKPVYMIEAISVPKELEQRGCTSETVGRRIVDVLNKIHAVRKRIERYGAFRALLGHGRLKVTPASTPIHQSFDCRDRELSDSIGDTCPECTSFDEA